MKLKYIECEQILSNNIIVLKKLEDFQELLVSQKVNSIFVLKPGMNTDLPDGVFTIPSDTIVYGYPCKGFRSLEDVEKAEPLGFNDGLAYYHALEMDLDNNKEYLSFTESEIKTKEEWQDFINKGFEGSFATLVDLDSPNIRVSTTQIDNKNKVNRGSIYVNKYPNSRKASHTEIIQRKQLNHNPIVSRVENGTEEFSIIKYFHTPNLKNDNDIYRLNINHAKFSDFDEMLNSIQAGFETKEEYMSFKESGFESKEELTTAKKKKFENAEDYHRASELGIIDFERYQIYLDIESEAKALKFKYPEEVLLKDTLSEPSYSNTNTPYPIDSIFSSWVTKTNQFYTRNIGIIPRNMKFFKQDKNYISIILDNEFVKEKYYSNKQSNQLFFRQHKKISNDSIIIDGSNVAWVNQSSNEGGVPSTSNIIMLLTQLKTEYSFKEVITIVDAALIHQVEDSDKLQELITKKSVIVAPASSDADDFLIQEVKAHKALLITNDTFKDWKEKDSWINENIDFFRIPFMIINGRISLDSKLKELLS